MEINSSLIKLCTKCSLTKPIDFFGKDKNNPDNLNWWCKPCVNLYTKNRRKTNEEAHRKELENKRRWRNDPKNQEKEKNYRLKNKEHGDKRSKTWYENNKERKREKGRDWVKNNPERYKIIVKRKNSKKTKVPLLNFQVRLRNAIYKACRKLNIKKDNKTFNILGFTPENLKDHFDKFIGKLCIVCENVQIELNNSNLDHIIPMCSATSEEEVIILNQLNNLRLICVKCNSNKIKDDLKYSWRSKNVK